MKRPKSREREIYAQIERELIRAKQREESVERMRLAYATYEARKA